MRASDRVVCLNGHVCCEGTPEAVSASPAYRALFGSEAQGTLALYQHHHDHDHDHVAEHVHGPDCRHSHHHHHHGRDDHA
jgi:zinc transport system ATP-binding protein